MNEILTRIGTNLVDRLGGPMSFRFFLQPATAILFAFLDGRRDAREGKTGYIEALFTDPAHRIEMLRRGWKSVVKIFVFALILDAVYQVRELHFFYPGEALIVAICLAIVPYLLLRGVFNRLIKLLSRKSAQ